MSLSSPLQKSVSPAEGLDQLHRVRNKRSDGGSLGDVQQDTGLHVTHRPVRSRRYEGGAGSRQALMGALMRGTAGCFSPLMEGVKESGESVRCSLILTVKMKPGTFSIPEAPQFVST